MNMLDFNVNKITIYMGDMLILRYLPQFRLIQQCFGVIYVLLVAMRNGVLFA
ncbi:hypothetical protein BC777_3751 [Yoonia maricola]|uniref:Uncharacterized protein n=1 Tax=Yoonia maricola TaxID=420999 RepID=A0A2M8W1A4_9RHOB|nr:hypothetical protein BC777_3751 [Yoonia maricola]